MIAIPFADIDNKLRRLLLGGIAIITAVIGAYLMDSSSGRVDGQAAAHKDWRKADAARVKVEQAAIAERNRKNDIERAEQQATNQKVIVSYEKRIQTLQDQYADARAAADRAGGLRISRAVCSSTAGPAEAASAGGADEATAGTLRLPRQIEDDLWRAALHSDEIVEQARALMAWIVEQGFAPKPSDLH